MASITTHYGIAGPVPFHDVDVHSDNRIFVDPHAVRLSRGPSPFAADAVLALDTFFDAVSADAMSAHAADHRHGLDLLQHFEEPWETRMGMAKTGFRGHGGSVDVGSWIWDALRGDLAALLRVGILKHLEDLPLFVHGIDRDITSDITTRIIYKALTDFTAAMVDAYPEFTAGTHTTSIVQRQVWDSTSSEWTLIDVNLPAVEGKPLLLVPAGWARPRLLMSAGRYYETEILTFAQLEQASSRNGKLLKTPKGRLKRQPELSRGRGTNKLVTARAGGAGHDILAQFRRFVDARALRIG
ncbi:hypothetical protein [Microbacterium sp. SMR1]|uniref:hypothetical protein n=1 Tax=Microbacterium sp. SMR1 TaxID=1497340 RepID=UPI000DCBC6F9|nr:hypothetical protein [Microbacterium sp. SMR1]RAZ30544.1 hypothetical protein DO944_13435 [Microbacterium sp. SMR1]